MAAESNPVRRLRRLIAPLLAAATVVWCSAGAGAAIADTHASSVDASAARTAAVAAATDDSEGGIHLSVAPVESTTVTTTAAQEMAVEVANDTSEALPAGTLRLLVADDALDDTAEIDAWSTLGAGDSDAAPASSEVGRADVRAILPGSSATVRIPVAAGAFDADSAVVGVAAELEVDGELLATGTGAFASATAPATAPVGLALAAPLTVPAQTTGLLPADRLEAWTAPAGLLTRQLEALGGRSIAIGVDPRIIASIRALGSSAPASAVAWLERLAALPNEVFPLAYADADLAVQAQLGLDGPLEPISFDDALNPDDFTGVTDGGDTTEGATATPMPTALPDSAELLDWPYTRTDLAWPADATVATGNLAWFAGAGLTSTILDPANVDAPGALVGAASTIAGSTAVVADARVTGALRQAAAASSETEWRSGAGRLIAELALAAADGDAGKPVTLLATFDRSAGEEAGRVQATVDAIDAVPWATPATLTDAIGAPPTPRTLIDLPEDDQRRSNVDRMLQAERSVDEFSVVLDDPTVLTAPTRRQLLSLLDVAWLPQPAEWTAAVGEWLIDQRATTNGVSVVPSSSVLVVASETGIPITVQNSLPYPVDVVVHVQPTNGRLIVEEPVDVTVEPESRSTVVVPVAAGVGNGEVSLEVSLTADDGTAIGDTVVIPANVHADWEGLGAGVLATIAVIVFGVGISRNIIRRRRRRAEESQAGATGADGSEGAEGDDALEGAEASGTDAADTEPAASATDAEPSASGTVPEPAASGAEPSRTPAAAPAPDRALEDPRDG